MMIDTPEKIQEFRLRTIIKGLEIEIKTGMHHSRVSLLKIAQTQYKVSARTKKGALKELKEMLPK